MIEFWRNFKIRKSKNVENLKKSEKNFPMFIFLIFWEFLKLVFGQIYDVEISNKNRKKFFSH